MSLPQENPMDIQSAALNELFVLYPVIIPGWVSPVKPADIAHGGIPKSLYDGQPNGLEVLVDPWTELLSLSQTLAVDDRVDLFINDDPTPVTGKTVGAGEEQLRIRLYVPHGRLRHGVNRLHYKVTRPGGNTDPSRDLNVLYHLRAPGEPAPESLDLVIPPDVIRDGVSAERAAQGVEFGFVYSNRRPYDRLRFNVGNATEDWEVPDTSVPVTQTLFTDTFQQAGDSANTLIEFMVFDQLGNFSQSSTKRLDIHLGRVELEKAILREILTENNDDPAIVDLDKLKGGPLWALVHLIDAIWGVGDEIHLTFTALVNGSPVASHDATLPIVQVPGQFSWEIPNGKVIADSVVRVGYEQIRGGKVIATSREAEARVVGKHQADERPVITSVTDTKGQEVGNGDSTIDVTVNVAGTADDNERVEIFDGSISTGAARANNGIWTHSVTGLAFGTHSLTAKALYGSEQVSEPPRAFTKIYVEDFESIPTSIIPVGGRISTAFFDIVYADGEPSSQIAVALAGVYTEGNIKGQSLHASYMVESAYTSPVQIELQLKMACSRVSFWSGTVSAPASVSFHNASGTLLGTRTIPHIAQGSILYLTDFSTLGISKITLSPSGRDGCLFDMFTFWP